mgnify:CR=1 FL=1
MKSILYISVAAISSLLISNSSINNTEKSIDTVVEQKPHFINSPHLWADSVFDTLTEDQRIAQLFMVAAYSNKGAKHEKEIETLISTYNLGSKS